MAKLEAEKAQIKAKLEEQLMTEKQLYIQHIQEVALRKMMKQGLLRGFSTWLVEYRAWKAQQEALEEAARVRREMDAETRRSTAALEKAAKALRTAYAAESEAERAAAEAKSKVEEASVEKARVQEVLRHMAAQDLRRRHSTSSANLVPTPPRAPRSSPGGSRPTPPRPRRLIMSPSASWGRSSIDAASPTLPEEEGEPSPKTVGLFRI